MFLVIIKKQTTRILTSFVILPRNINLKNMHMKIITKVEKKKI